MSDHVDTIAAIATPPGRGGVGVIRISGPAVSTVATTLLGGLPEPRRAVYREFRSPDGSVLDSGLAIHFRAPASYTGEDVLELQGHGGPVVLDALLACVLNLGCRAAAPGEFTRRAYDNNKLDLTQAEAVADLIDAESVAAARAAQRSLTGAFSRRIEDLCRELLELRTWVEASIDFADEDIDFLADGEVAARLDRLTGHLFDLQRRTRHGRALSEGLRVAILGAPNVGKSSLLNQLAGQDAAIVTDVAGTTRDVLRERIVLGDLPILLLDTAGIRETDDPVERIGVGRAWAAVDDADLVLMLRVDGEPDPAKTDPVFAVLAGDPRVIPVHNKCDRSGAAAGAREDGSVAISALNGAGIEDLIAVIRERSGLQANLAGEFSARRRHLDAIERASAVLQRAGEQLHVHGAPELLAEDLSEANRILGEINGPVDTETLLGEIFSSFCVGK
ncbi:tRNA uridine-5-carboxymethylaminomethyl(34) synthesis GTPase MnmE [uncultured Abyssibacter sp.]|uniref:tRNA uridine-5-carboxymethylaminomethyl(34) synthesis GTPase MnmE n=1 Tax=uncultured Abyssibacter sp. TaxID=2320202 RepID=UPI0032B2B746